MKRFMFITRTTFVYPLAVTLAFMVTLALFSGFGAPYLISSTFKSGDLPSKGDFQRSGGARSQTFAQRRLQVLGGKGWLFFLEEREHIQD